MRSIMIALVLAAGFGIAGASPTLSAPASSTILGDIAKSDSSVVSVRWHRHCRHYRHSHRRCHRSWR